MHPMGGSAGWRAWRYLGDGVAAAAAWCGAVYLRVFVPLPFTHGLLPAERVALVHPVLVLVLALQLLTLYLFNQYHSPEPRARLELASRPPPPRPGPASSWRAASSGRRRFRGSRSPPTSSSPTAPSRARCWCSTSSSTPLCWCSGAASRRAAT